MRVRPRAGFVVRAALVVGAAALTACEPAPPALVAPDAREWRVHREAIVVDGHNDVTTWMLDYGFDLGMDGGDPDKRRAELYWILGWLLPTPKGEDLRTHTDLDRLQAGGVDAQFFSIFPHPAYASEPGGLAGRAHAMIDVLAEQLDRHAGRMELATSAGDVRRIVGRGRLAALMGLEGGHGIEGDLDTLREFHARGVRYMTITWSNTHDWADSSGDEPRHDGLTPFGREVVCEMNRLGMLVDISHVSDDTFWDVMETTRAPVVASHSSARALNGRPRNMDDRMLRAVAENGGVVMVNFGGTFIDPDKETNWEIFVDLLTRGGSPVTLDMLLDHIEHVARVAGVQSVGLGSDYDGTLFMPTGLEDVSGLPRITAGLLRRGWSEDEVALLLGENALRVMEQAETAAALLPSHSDCPPG